MKKFGLGLLAIICAGVLAYITINVMADVTRAHAQEGGGSHSLVGDVFFAGQPVAVSSSQTSCWLSVRWICP